MVKIYRLTSTRDITNIRYVGKTINDLEVRLAGHKYGKSDTHSKRWIKKELKDGYEIIITLIEEVSDDIWEEKERFWILYYLNMGYRLCNIQHGGLSASNIKPENSKLKEESIRKGLYDKIEKAAIPVYQINRKGKTIQKYKSIIQASGMTGISFDKIFNCCERFLMGEDCHIYSHRFIYEGTIVIKRKFSDAEIRKEIEEYLFYKNQL